MNDSEDRAVIVEYTRVSDKDFKPSNCIACGHETLARCSHKIIDRQDLGTPTVHRIQQHEKILWKCKKCGTRFSIINPNIEFDSSFTNDVKVYVFKRVLETGDSTTRVAADLKNLHNVDVDTSTLLDWIQKKKEQDMNAKPGINASPPRTKEATVICLDGTFKAVTPKKNDPGSEKDEPFCLHLTRLKDGRLAAYWESGSEKKKRSRS
jgi:transcription elongation factor Elf1